MIRNELQIGIVARGLTKGGVGKFITNVLREWNRDISVANKIVVYTDELAFVKRYPNLKVIYLPKKPKILWDIYYLYHALKRENPTTVIYTKNVIPLTHLFGHWKKVVVVYDLAFFHPELRAYKALDTLYMKVMTKITLPFADKIMAISKFTKSEIIKFLKIPEDKIFVNYLGVAEKYKKITSKKVLDNVVKKYELKLPFIFYCGSLSPRKNILRLVQAFHLVQHQIPHHLYLISGKTWNNPGIEKYITVNQLQDRIHLLPFIPEEDLIAFYSLADTFVYPSLYEGFGLPIIEAQACGCHILVLKSAINSEIAGKNAAFFELNGKHTVYDLSQSLVETAQRKHDLLEITFPKRAEFVWSLSAQRLLKQANE